MKKTVSFFVYLLPIFFSPSPLLSVSPSNHEVTVVCVGDVMMAYGMKATLKKKGADYPFERVRPLFAGADIVFGNLENPISNRGEKAPAKDFTFRMDPPHAAALKRAGFDVMSLANNHILDFGTEALEDTLAELKKLGIRACGAGRNMEEARRPAILSAGSRRVAFLAYHRTPPIYFSATSETPGTALAEPVFLEQDIRLAKSTATWVIVSFHWGKEYTAIPSRALRRLAHTAVDSGADLVVGHHPHAAQAIELYKGKVIAYSLGNFVFGTRNPKAKEAILLKVRFAPDGSSRAEIVPLWVDNAQVHYQPHLLEGKQAEKFLARLSRLSKRFKTNLRIVKTRAYLP